MMNIRRRLLLPIKRYVRERRKYDRLVETLSKLKITLVIK